MLLAFGRNGARDVDLSVRDYTFEALAQRLAKPTAGPKDGSYLLRGGDLIEPKRADANLKSAELLIIDGDSRFDPETGEVLSGAPPIDTTIAALNYLGLRYIVHTSYSYLPGEKWKYRIFIPARLRDTMELSAAVNYVIERLNAAGCYIADVKENHTWAQAWYLPRCRPEYVDAFVCRASLSGNDVDVQAAVQWQQARTAGEDALKRATEAQPSPPKPERGASVIEAFNAASSLGWVRQQLEAKGYKFAGKKGDSYRYISPTSESGTAGVVVFKGKRGDWCTYSHHGAHDPLSGHLTDPFGLYALFEYGGDTKAAVAAIAKEAGTNSTRDPFAGFEEVQQDFREARREEPATPGGQLFIPSKAFADAWKPAEYLVDGFIQRGYCYSLTSPTGHGKTAVIMLMAACIGTGKPFAGAETLPGKVGYFAAENPNDVQARWIGMQDEMGFVEAGVWFCPDTINLADSYDRIAAEVEAAGGSDLIVVDTSQAFFQGDDENSNSQMVAHAKAMRRLCTLPGNPCVIILCHPVKNPSRDNLLPRGGGGFLAEVDGNLSLWNDGGNLLFHHQGKFRGPGFAPVNFTLRTVAPFRLKDTKGRQISTVVAEFLTEEQYNTRLLDNASDQDIVMILILNGKGKISITDIARTAGWTLSGGAPNKMKVHRILAQLKDAKLAAKRRNGRWALTAGGKKEIGPKAKAMGIDAAGDEGEEGEEF